MAGDAYYNKGDSAAAAEMFGKAYTVNGSISAARKLGELHFAMSSSASEDSEKLNELSKAAESYSVAYESEFCTAEDIVNLSKVYRLTAKYSNGRHEGMHFGGCLDRQKQFTAVNLNFAEQSRSMPRGVALTPYKDDDSQMYKVIVPVIGGEAK